MLEEKSIGYFRGLKIDSDERGLNKVKIGPGFIIPAKNDDPYWNSDLIYINENDSYVDIITNNDSNGHIGYVVARARNYIIGNKFAKIDFFYRDVGLVGSADEFPNSMVNRDEYLLGFVYNPPVKSTDVIVAVRSVSCNENEYSFVLDPFGLHKRVVKGSEEWYNGVFYIKKQLVYYNSALYYCKKTHTSTNNFNNDVNIYDYWIPLLGMSVEDITLLVEEIVSELDIEAMPAPPVNSVQYNIDGNTFGGSANFLWFDILKKLQIDGQIELKVQSQAVSNPLDNYIKIYADEVDGMLYLKVKLENGRDYIITSLQK